MRSIGAGEEERQRRRNGEPSGADGTGGGGIIQGALIIVSGIFGACFFGALLAALPLGLSKKRDKKMCQITTYYVYTKTGKYRRRQSFENPVFLLT